MSEVSIKPPAKNYRKKPIVMNQKPQATENSNTVVENERNHVFAGVIPAEVKYLTHNGLINVMSRAPTNDREKLQTNLLNSQYIKAYLSSYVNVEMISKFDDHSKFALCYLANWIDSNLSQN